MAEKAGSKLKGNIWRLIILAVAGSLIYGLPYFRTYYYDAYLEAYNLTNTQMGSLGAMFGVFGMISYLFGGVVADFISTKKLLSISLILTGVAGFAHLFATNYSMLLVIYLVWGFTALFAFWPALLKGIRSLASPDEQGKAYGFMEAGRGVMNAVHLAIALAIITSITNAKGSASGLNGGIVFYSVVVIVLGVLVFLFFKDPEESEKSERFNFKQVLTVVKLPQVWILCLILCCTYVMNMSYAYFNPYATSALGVAMVGGTIVTIMADYIRPFASVGGGVLADRIGRSLMEDGGVPMEVSGTAIGLISTIGYLPEVVCPAAAGIILDTYSVTGYKYYFIAVAVVMLVGIVGVVIWNRSIKNMKSLGK